MVAYSLKRLESSLQRYQIRASQSHHLVGVSILDGAIRYAYTNFLARERRGEVEKYWLRSVQIPA